MGKQAKAKTSKGARNDARPNGKAWKQSHGNNPPTEQAQKDHNRSVKRNLK